MLKCCIFLFVTEGSLLLGALALSGSRLSVVVGVLCGAAICVLLLVVAGLLLRFRRSRSARHWKQEEQHLSAGSAQSTISRHSHGNIFQNHSCHTSLLIVFALSLH